MKNNLINVLLAILGGAVTFIVLYFGVYVSIYNKFEIDFFSTQGFFMMIFIMFIMVFSFFMTFLYYYLLTKNKTPVIDNSIIDPNTPQPILQEKKVLVLIGLLTTFVYFLILTLYSDYITSFVYCFGLLFLTPFVLTRKWSWPRRVVWITLLFAGGFLFEYVLTS